ncbi:MAG: hypothetical protein ACM3SY_09385 [Candidatus Omnitrophota bacterium]
MIMQGRCFQLTKNKANVETSFHVTEIDVTVLSGFIQTGRPWN